MEEKKIGKEEEAASQIVDLVVKVMLKQLMMTSTPIDWAKAGTGHPDITLPVTLNFPKKFVEKVLSLPGAKASLNLFVTLAIAHYVTYKAEDIVDGLEKGIKGLLKTVEKPKESPDMKVRDLTKEYMKRIVVS